MRQLLAGAGNIRGLEEVSVGLEQMGWTVHPVRYRGKIVGAILEKDGELHTSIAPEFQKRWNPRPYIRNILYPALNKYKELYSDASKADPTGQRWLTGLGFEYLKEDDERIYYVLKRFKFRRLARPGIPDPGPPCQNSEAPGSELHLTKESAQGTSLMPGNLEST